MFSCEAVCWEPLRASRGFLRGPCCLPVPHVIDLCLGYIVFPDMKATSASVEQLVSGLLCCCEGLRFVLSVWVLDPTLPLTPLVFPCPYLSPCPLSPSQWILSFGCLWSTLCSFGHLASQVLFRAPETCRCPGLGFPPGVVYGLSPGQVVCLGLKEEGCLMGAASEQGACCLS